MQKTNKVYKEDVVNNYKELLEKCSKKYNKKVAFSYDKFGKIIDVSYVQFHNDIKNLGTGLLNINLRNKKIGIISPDRYEWCVSYLAIATSGNVVVPLDYALTENEIISSIERSEISCIFSIKNIQK